MEAAQQSWIESGLAAHGLRTTGPTELVSRLGSRFFGRDIVFEADRELV